ncbi:MAG TPA: hypothetical protein PLN94_12130, partial [Thiolinea sp.]|nr:hypothetical protein [Thiolinea sp.]
WPSPPPTRRPPVTLEGRSWHTATTTPPAAPGTETPAVQPPPSTRAATAKTPPARKKVVWRKGHGLIERVDKLSGEIFHLVEIET